MPICHAGLLVGALQGQFLDITRSRLSIAFLTGSAKLQGLAMFPPSVLYPNMVEGNRDYLSKVLS